MSTISLDEESIQRTLSILNSEYVIMITGQSFSGKGTLVESILKACPVACRPKSSVSTGELFRKHIPRFSPDIRRRLQEISDAGELQDPAIAASLVTNEVNYTWKKDKLLIIEGSPRSVKEANILYPYLTRTTGKNVFLVHLTINDALAMERAKGRNTAEERAGGERRTDTKDEASIRRKLAYHKRDVIPGVEAMDRNGTRVTQVHVRRDMTPLDVFMKVMDRAPIFQGVH